MLFIPTEIAATPKSVPHSCRILTLVSSVYTQLSMQRRLHRLIVPVVLVIAAIPTRTLIMQAQSPSASSAAAAGQQTFSTCAGCHGLDGAGGEHAPDIATAPNVQRMSDAALTAIIRNGIPGSAMPGFGKLLSDAQVQGVLKYLRVLQGNRNPAISQGNASRGRELFFGSAGCSDCHMVNGRGGFFAADLSNYAKGRSEATMRKAIITPDKDLDVRRGTITVTTRAGKTYRGLIRNEDNFSLQMQTADGTFPLYDKADMAVVKRDVKSLMPSDYGSKLTAAEIDDLISFLSQVARATERQDGATETQDNEEHK